MSATAPEMMNPNGLRVLTQEAPHGKPPKVDTKTVETKSSSEGRSNLQIYADRERNPAEAAKREQENYREITTSTKITAGDTLVRQYLALKDVMKQHGADMSKPPLSDYATFIRSFETAYLEQTKQNISTGNPSENDLKKFARELMDNKEHGDMYMLWAIKIAESQQSLLQAVTGAYVVVPSDKSGDEMYVATLRAHGPNGMDDVTQEHVMYQEGNWISRLMKKGKYAVWALQEPRGDKSKNLEWQTKEPQTFERSSQSSRDVFFLHKKMLQLQAENPRQTIEYVSFLRENPQVNLDNVQINGRPLTDVDRALLLRGFGQVGAEMYHGSELSITGQHKVSMEISKIIDARTNFYEHIIGKDLRSINFRNPQPGGIDDFNMIEPVPPPKGPQTPTVTEYRTKGRGRQDKIALGALGFDPIGGQSLEVMVSGGVDPVDSLKVIEAGLVKHLESVLDDKQRERTRNTMEYRIAELKKEVDEKKESEKAKAIREAPVTDDTGIQFWKEKKRLLDERKKITDERAEADRVIKNITAHLNAESPIVNPNIPNGGHYTYAEVLQNYTEAELNLNTANSEFNASQAELNRLLKQQTDIQNENEEIDKYLGRRNLSQQDKDRAEAKRDNNLKILMGDQAQGIRSLAEQISDQQVDLAARSNTRQQRENELRIANNTYPEGIRKQVADEISTRNEKLAEVAKKDSELIEKNSEIGTALRKVPNDPNSEYTEDEVKKKLEELNKELTVLSPDRFKQRQLEVYLSLQERTTPETYNAIRNRAFQAFEGDTAKVLHEARILHPNYPPAYLRLLQVVYSEGITEPAAQEEFVKATHLLTPDVFVRALQNRNIPITGSNDPRMNDEWLISQVDKQLVSDIFKDLLMQAKTGDLGKFTDNEQHMIETIEKTTAFDIKKVRAEKNKVIDDVIDAIVNVSVKPQDIEDSLKKVPAINAQNIGAYASEIIAARSAGTSRDQIATDLAAKHSIADVHANAIVEKAFGVYAERTGAVQTASNIMETSLRQRRELTDATTLAAAALMISETNDRHEFLALIEQGQSIDQIVAFYNLTPLNQQTEFAKDFIKLVDRIDNLKSTKPDFNINDFNKQIRLALALHLRRKRNLALPAAMTSNVRAELNVLTQLIDSLEQRNTDEMYISNMNNNILMEGTVDEITLELLHMNNQSVTSAVEVSYQKMVATEIVKRRDATRRRNVATAPAQQSGNP